MPNYKISSGLPSHPAGLSDKEASLLLPVYRAVSSLADNISIFTGNVELTSDEQARLDPFTLATSGNSNQVVVKASEDLTFGVLVNLYLVGGVVTARKSQATTPNRQAHGIVNTTSGIAAGETGMIIFMSGRCQGIGGTEFGRTYWLSNNGAVQNVPATGYNVQQVGIGLGSAGFWLNIVPVVGT